VLFVKVFAVRMLFVTAALLVGLGSAPAFADELTEGVFEAPLKIKELSMICESARLTDMERRECRAMFKNATSDDKMLVAYKVFDERINGPSD
jgi:predicted DsbA family dithiol-disulfide isomerase